MKRFLITEDEKKYIRNLYNLIVESPIPGLDLKSGVYWFIVEDYYSEYYVKNFIDGWNQIKNVCDISKIYNEVRKINSQSTEYNALLSLDKQRFGKTTDIEYYSNRWHSLLVIVNDKNEITKLVAYSLSQYIKTDVDEIIAAIKTTKFTPTEPTVPKVEPTVEPTVEPKVETQTSEKSPEAQGLIGKSVKIYKKDGQRDYIGELKVIDIIENFKNGVVKILVEPTETYIGNKKSLWDYKDGKNQLKFSCENYPKLTTSTATLYSPETANIFFKKYCVRIGGRGVLKRKLGSQ